MLNNMSNLGIHRGKDPLRKNVAFYAKISAMSAFSVAAIAVWANSSLMNCIKDRDEYYKRGVYRMVPERSISAAYYYCRKNT